MDYRGAVVDLDGTVYRGETPIDGAAEATGALRERGLRLLFVTNNPTKSPGEYVDLLAGMGIETTESAIVSAGVVTAEYLADEHHDDHVFLVGSPGLRDQLLDHDVSLVTDPGDADVVVTSHDVEFDYRDMTEGLWALDSADAFYGSDPDLTYPGDDGRTYPGSGAITRAVAGVAERDPDLVFGKPSEPTAEAVLDRLHCEPEECLVVGDSLTTDVAFGNAAGMTTVLVLTGRTTHTTVRSSDVTPDHVVDALPDALELL